ncbi:MAG: quinolinate synthase NadA [Spirochaetaceae bacterium]|jgi:quinolinate synthase|nr:quinolinate synthase NadA [Spirochaetaceae bacterium]
MKANELYEKLKKIHFEHRDDWQDLQMYCESKIELINRINSLKKEKNAIVVAHTYVPPEILYGVADYVGDSYELSRYARDSKAQLIIYAAVRFMGETAKILSPNKDVIVPAEDGGCTLADSITGEDVLKLRQQYPDYHFACYINTTADVKAACDVVVTSSNVYDIMEHYPSDKIYFVPDKLMGANILEEMERRGVKKQIRLWDGTCYVHEEFDFDQAFTLKKAFPDLEILSHPECKPNVIDNSDYSGSTSQIYDYIKNKGKGRYIIFSECGLASRLEVEQSDDLIIQGPCHACKYMKSNSLEAILKALENPKEEDYIQVDDETIKKASRSLNRMFELVDQIKRDR